MRTAQGFTAGVALVLSVCAAPVAAAPAGMDTIALPIEEAAYELSPNQFVWQDSKTDEAFDPKAFEKRSR